MNNLPDLSSQYTCKHAVTILPDPNVSPHITTLSGVLRRISKEGEGGEREGRGKRELERERSRQEGRGKREGRGRESEGRVKGEGETGIHSSSLLWQSHKLACLFYTATKP
jgi:hypothetical protein